MFEFDPPQGDLRVAPCDDKVTAGVVPRSRPVPLVHGAFFYCNIYAILGLRHRVSTCKSLLISAVTVRAATDALTQ